ncbi:MAG: hypothetical protein M3169_15320 [Candidatus Eremiobacteraeota bacterium]|nr:hypothetical protein [Candidatus Eremiobacteraeota bacterium]
MAFMLNGMTCSLLCSIFVWRAESFARAPAAVATTAVVAKTTVARLRFTGHLGKYGKRFDDRRSSSRGDCGEDAVEVPAPRIGDLRVRLDAALREMQPHEARVVLVADPPYPASSLKHAGQPRNGALLQAEARGKAVLGEPGLARNLQQRMCLGNGDGLPARRLAGLVQAQRAHERNHVPLEHQSGVVVRRKRPLRSHDGSIIQLYGCTPQLPARMKEPLRTASKRPKPGGEDTRVTPTGSVVDVEQQLRDARLALERARSAQPNWPIAKKDPEGAFIDLLTAVEKLYEVVDQRAKESRPRA